MKRVVTALILIFALQNAWAIDIDSAKSQGLVGEANTGYLAAVKQPVSAEVQALISDVNRKRRAQFERTAKSTGATVDQVRVRFYQLALQKTARGHYYQDGSGAWKRK
ncbi:MAG: YdbL family protein [Pseudomonadota bacterium]